MNNDVVRVGVGVVVMKNNDILLGKRKGSHCAGLWALPGGHLEMWESFNECVAREVREEVGISVTNIRQFCFVNHPLKKESKHYVTLVFLADYEAGELQLLEPEKCEAWMWCKLDKFCLPKSHEVFPSLDFVFDRLLKLQASASGLDNAVNILRNAVNNFGKIKDA